MAKRIRAFKTMTKSKTFVVEKCKTGNLNIVNERKGYNESFYFPNKDAIEFSAIIKSFKEGDRIELKIIEQSSKPSLKGVREMK